MATPIHISMGEAQDGLASLELPAPQAGSGAHWVSFTHLEDGTPESVVVQQETLLQGVRARLADPECPEQERAEIRRVFKDQVADVFEHTVSRDEKKAIGITQLREYYIARRPDSELAFTLKVMTDKLGEFEAMIATLSVHRPATEQEIAAGESLPDCLALKGGACVSDSTSLLEEEQLGDQASRLRLLDGYAREQLETR